MTRRRQGSGHERGKPSCFVLYFCFLLLPIYWLVGMSLKTNEEILGGLTLFPRGPRSPTTGRSSPIPTWYNGYINSLIYVAINTVLSIGVALPAAYAFSRYRFIGDKHMFFWLLTNRMAPPAVFLLPFFQLYQASACSTRTRPWRSRTAVQRAAGGLDPRRIYVRRAPEIDETAYLDGYSLPSLLPAHLPATDHSRASV